MAYAKQWMMVLVVLALGYVAVVLLAYVGQRSLLYFPTRAVVPSGLQPWKVGDVVLAYARGLPNPERVWLMLHGNGGQAAHRDYILQCVGRRDAVYVMEYPGYGVRPGQPSENSINRAAVELYRILRDRHPNAHVGVIGESLGSGPACVLAREATPPDEIVLITPFDSLLHLASRYKWYLPVRLILKDRWDNIAALRGYRGHVRIFAAEHDTIIPVVHAQALATATGAQLTIVPAGHNDWMHTTAVRL